jgi:hypothetical protein
MECYIPVGGDLYLTHRAVDSLIRDAPDLNIVLVNNTEQDIRSQFASPRFSVVDMPVRLLHGQSINWMVRDTAKRGSPFCMSLHNDAYVNPGAISDIVSRYEEVKDTPWSAIFSGSKTGDALVLWNPTFFYKEKVWHLPGLLPFYYLDNLMYRMMSLRNWHLYNSGEGFVVHEGSHTIKNNAVQSRINDICFKYHGMIYNEIWGGPPGKETSKDITANGVYPIDFI